MTPKFTLLATALAGLVALSSAGAQQGPASQDEETLHAEGKVFAVRSLWRSERVLDGYAKEGLSICDAVAEAAGVTSRDGLLEIGIAPSPRGVLTLLDSAPEHALAMPGLPFDERQIPSVAAWPELHDRTLFWTKLPPATKRQLALVAGDMCVDAEAEGRAGLALAAAQAGMEAVGASRPVEEEPWTGSGLAELQSQLSSAEDAPARLLELAAEAEVGLGVPITLRPGQPHAAGAAEMAALLLATAGDTTPGDLVKEIAAMDPHWRVEAGAAASHEFGWCVTATREADGLMLSAAPVEAERYTITTELFLLSNDLRTPPQADVVFGDRDGDRFLLACSTQQGIYLFRREGPGAPYVGLAEQKSARIPVGRRIPVRIDVDQDRINVTVGGVKLDPVRVGDRPLTGSYGPGAHAGSTALFRDPGLEIR